MTASASSEFWQVGEERLDEYVALGHRRQRFFPHRIYRLPKCGPDGFNLAQRMCGKDDPERMREIVLYAEPPVLTEFPPDLFFDDELVWHQQQFGLPGQVACANLVLAGDDRQLDHPRFRPRAADLRGGGSTRPGSRNASTAGATCF